MARTPRRKLKDVYGDLNFYTGTPENEIDRKLIECVRNLDEVVKEFIAKGWCSSVREFGLAVNVPHPGLIKILQGVTVPDMETVAKIETVTERSIWNKQNRSRPDVMPKLFKERITAIRDQKGARGVQVRFIDQLNADRERLQQQEMKRRKKR